MIPGKHKLFLSFFWTRKLYSEATLKRRLLRYSAANTFDCHSDVTHDHSES